MSDSTYTLKISPQGQVTLPRQLRDQLHVKPGARVVAVVGDDGSLRLSGKPLISKHFGTLPNAWTSDGEDAAEYSRKLRDSMQPKTK